MSFPDNLFEALNVVCKSAGTDAHHCVAIAGQLFVTLRGGRGDPVELPTDGIFVPPPAPPFVPRLKDPDGHTELVKVPWADKQSQWTMLFERLAIDLL
jgi:hypothetical protein